MNVLDLFSGIGGFSLGLERAGMRTVAFCEIDPFCRRVLAKHWPGVPCYDDVRELTAARLAADGIAVDVICGGFPCQDISVAGKGAGIDGVRSGLWAEYARIIGDVRPLFVIVENVAALLGRGLDRVLGDLAALGFDAEWHCIPASAVGAPHRRDRIWIVAYPSRNAIRDQSGWGRRSRGADTAELGHDGAPQSLAHPVREGQSQSKGAERQERGWPSDSGHALANPDARGRTMCGKPPAFPNRLFVSRDFGGGEAWRSESGIRRVADGVPNRVDRIGSLGNAVVPQIPEIIGRAIMNPR